jgi:hypothetical protein
LVPFISPYTEPWSVPSESLTGICALVILFEKYVKAVLLSPTRRFPQLKNVEDPSDDKELFTNTLPFHLGRLFTVTQLTKSVKNSGLIRPEISNKLAIIVPNTPFGSDTPLGNHGSVDCI